VKLWEVDNGKAPSGAPLSNANAWQSGNRQYLYVVIGKTKTFLGLNALQNLVSDSMAIDMGSASTIIAVRGAASSSMSRRSLPSTKSRAK
jgi:hypothetical protein